MEDLNENTHELKIVFIGNSGVGKTTLIQRYIKETFEEQTQPTVGSMFFSKELEVGSRQFKLQVKKKENLKFIDMGYSRSRKI